MFDVKRVAWPLAAFITTILTALGVQSALARTRHSAAPAHLGRRRVSGDDRQPHERPTILAARVDN